MSTVTVSKELRLRLKQLAARYDTTQAEIIKRSIDLYEKHASELESTVVNERSRIQGNASIESDLANARERFERDFPRVASIHAALRGDVFLEQEYTIGQWDLPFEE